MTTTEVLSYRKEWTQGQPIRFSPALTALELPDVVQYRWTDYQSSPPVKVESIALPADVAEHAAAGDVLLWTFGESWAFISRADVDAKAKGEAVKTYEPAAVGQTYLMAAVELAKLATRGSAYA